MQVIKDWLTDTTRQLSSVKIVSAKLDAEIILAHTLNQDRTYLHAHPEQIICSIDYQIANDYLSQRLNRIPIAYIVGCKEFYGRQFTVTPDTLIPRPESEDIITLLVKFLLANHMGSTKLKLIDVGTGSGCLGITAKLEFPSLDVTLADISTDALKVAIINANDLSADVAALQSDLLQNYTSKPDIIIANLPYVDKTWERSPETDHEPALALFADDQGLSIIKNLIAQSSNMLEQDGCIIIEADPVQHDLLIEYAQKRSFYLAGQLGYALAFQKTK